MPRSTRAPSVQSHQPWPGAWAVVCLAWAAGGLGRADAEPQHRHAATPTLVATAGAAYHAAGGHHETTERLPSLGAPLLRRLAVTPHGGFGDPRPARHGTHEGLDFVTSTGDVVVSATDGTVARIALDPAIDDGGHGGGHYLIVASAGFEIGYFHLHDIIVAVGATVKKGETLATIDNNHLHFQVARRGQPVDVSRLVPAMALTHAPARAAEPLPPPPPSVAAAPIAPRTHRAEVWLLTEDAEVPLYSQLPGGAGFGHDGHGEGFGPQCVYPDGTPARARFWLPKANLDEVGFSPVVRGSFLMGGDPQAESDPRRHERGAGGWRKDTRALADAPHGWVYYRDYACPTEGDPGAARGADTLDRRLGANVGNDGATPAKSPRGTSLAVPLVLPDVSFDRERGGRGGPADLLFEGAGPYVGGWAHRVDDACRGSVGDGGGPRYGLHFVASFDWRTHDPAIAAPIWLWLNLGDPANMKFRVRGAELYRADLQAIAAAGEPSELPGRAWLDLHFLEAMASGAHGMAAYSLLNADGSLNEANLGRFVADSRKNGWGWDTILGWGQRHGAMLAAVAASDGSAEVVGPHGAVSAEGTGGARAGAESRPERGAVATPAAATKNAPVDRAEAARAARRLEAEQAAEALRQRKAEETARAAEAARVARTAQAERIETGLEGDLRRAQTANQLATTDAARLEAALAGLRATAQAADEAARAERALALPAWKSIQEATGKGTRARRLVDSALEFARRAADLAKESQSAIEAGGPIGPAAALAQRAGVLATRALDAAHEGHALAEAAVAAAHRGEEQAAGASRTASARAEKKGGTVSAATTKPVEEEPAPGTSAEAASPRATSPEAEGPRATSPEASSVRRAEANEPSARLASANSTAAVASAASVADAARPAADAARPAEDAARPHANATRPTSDVARPVAASARPTADSARPAADAAQPAASPAAPLPEIGDLDAHQAAKATVTWAHDVTGATRRVRAMLEEVGRMRAHPGRRSGSARNAEAAEAAEAAQAAAAETARLDQTRAAADLADRSAAAATEIANGGSLPHGVLKSSDPAVRALGLARHAAGLARDASGRAMRAAYFARKLEQTRPKRNADKAIEELTHRIASNADEAERLARDAAAVVEAARH